MNSYVESHREKTTEIYENLNETMKIRKKSLTIQHNESKHEPTIYQPGSTVHREVKSNIRNRPTSKSCKEKAVHNRNIKKHS